MSRNKIMKTTALFLILIGSSGCLSIFQPIERIEKRYTFVDMDAPALRLAQAVENIELLEKIDGNWTSIGLGDLPAGAYIKGRKPKEGAD